MVTNYPVHPRVRAYGKARIEIAQRAKNPEDWERLWVRPTHPFPFVWGESWKHCVEYKVDDFAAEVGFFIDVLGLPVNALDPGYAMFTSPQGDFYLSIVPVDQGEVSTPPDAIRLQFMLDDILITTRELEKRGISFEQTPQPVQPGSSLYISYFRTPHGICVDLWGRVKVASPGANELELSQPALELAELRNNGELDRDEEEDEADENGDDGVFPEEERETEHDEDEEDEDEDEFEDDEEELGENGDGDGLDEDEEDDGFDEDEVDEDFDEDDDYDDDEFDQDEDRAEAISAGEKSSPVSTPATFNDAKPKAQGIHLTDQNTPTPEYIDLEAT